MVYAMSAKTAISDNGSSISEVVTEGSNLGRATDGSGTRYAVLCDVSIVILPNYSFKVLTHQIFSYFSYQISWHKPG